MAELSSLGSSLEFASIVKKDVFWLEEDKVNNRSYGKEGLDKWLSLKLNEKNIITFKHEKMEDNKVEITIDDQNRIRIMDVDVYKESEQLRSDCLEMIKSKIRK